ncbi:unnamed protein product, partial [Didymodactylos carnosus]
MLCLLTKLNCVGAITARGTLIRTTTTPLKSLRLPSIPKRYESISISQRASNRQQQALIRGGLAVVAIGGVGYLLNKVLNSPHAAINVPGGATAVGSRTQTFDEAVAANRPFSEAVKRHLRSTYLHFAGGLAMTGTFAYYLHRTGWATRIMTMNKWTYLGVSFVGTLGALFATQAIDDRQHPVLKYSAWTVFNGALALSLSPVFFSAPALVSRAALYTAGIVGSITAVGMTARREQYLWIGAPLMAGLVVVCLSSIGAVALPMRFASIAQNISLYGGLVVFSGLVLWDTQNIIKHAEEAQMGMRKELSPINESLGIYLDSINLF